MLHSLYSRFPKPDGSTFDKLDALVITILDERNDWDSINVTAIFVLPPSRYNG